MRDTISQFAVEYVEQAQIDFAMTYATMHCKRGTPYPRKETKVHWKGLGRLAVVRHLLGGALLLDRRRCYFLPTLPLNSLHLEVFPCTHRYQLVYSTYYHV